MTNAKTKKVKFLLQVFSVVMVLCLSVGSVFIVKANVGNKANTFSAEEEVKPAYYLVGAEDSSFTYGKNASISDGTEGLSVTYTLDSDRMVLRQVIDLYELSMDSIITFRPAPANKGTADFARVRVDLVDVYDPEIRVSYRTQNHPGNLNGEQASYTMSKSNVGKYTGYNHGVQGWCSDDYGTGGKFPFYDGDSACLSFYYDPVENKPWMSSRWTGYGGNTLSNVKSWITDLDDSTVQGANVFKGFTTGEVYVEVWIEELQTSKGTLFIEQYGKYDLSSNVLVDEKGPAINVDYADYDEDSIPDAIVGCKYPVFDATAFDLYTGKEDVSVKAFYNYYSTSKKEVAISRGAFVPTMAGNYTIEYKSVDDEGNVSVKLVEVEAHNSTDIEVLEVELGDYQTSVKLGEKYCIPEVEVENNIGKEIIAVEVTNQGKQLEVVDGYVRAEAIGKMNVKITVTDFVGQRVVKDIEVTVGENDKPTFVELPVLPEYFIEGIAYDLPKISAYNYIDGSGDKVETTIKAEYKNSTSPVTSKYVPTVTDHKDSVKIIYQAQVGNSGVATYAKDIPVYKVKTGNNIEVAKYFDEEGGSVTATSANIVLRTNEDDASFTFVNAQRLTSFAVDFVTNENSRDLSTFSIYLTDYADHNKQIKFTYKNNGGNILFYYNGDIANALSIPFDFNAGRRLALSYDDLTKKVLYDNTKGTTLTVEKDLNGNAFNGFTDNRYYVSFELVGEAGGEMILSTLNGSALTNGSRDWIGPKICFTEDYGGEYQLNDVYRLPRAIVADVFEGAVEVKLTVAHVSENDDYTIVKWGGVALEDYVLSGNEDIEIKLSAYGTYDITYYAVDSYGNRINGPSNYLVYVVDDVMPEIKPETKLPTQVKLGDKIHVPKLVVKDNKDSAIEDYTVMIILPTGRVENFDISGGDMGFIARETGTYTVIYSVRDSAGNVNNLVYTITVKEVA